jgi:hypothetical protein
MLNAPIPDFTFAIQEAEGSYNFNINHPAYLNPKKQQ